MLGCPTQGDVFSAVLIIIWLRAEHRPFAGRLAQRRRWERGNQAFPVSFPKVTHQVSLLIHQKGVWEGPEREVPVVCYSGSLHMQGTTGTGKVPTLTQHLSRGKRRKNAKR